MEALLVSLLVASLLGSFHCLGMCGGFVALYVGRTDGDSEKIWLRHMSYNGGRLLVYLVLGFSCGWLGEALQNTGGMIGLERVVTLFVGGAMILWGLFLLAQLCGWGKRKRSLGKKRPSKLAYVLKEIRRLSPTSQAFLLGTMSAFLPCGWLYSFVIVAAATFSPLKGALVMAAFWLGTLPHLLSFGWGMRWFRLRLQHRLPWLHAGLMILFGLFTVGKRLWMPTLGETVQQRALNRSEGADCHGVRLSPVKTVSTQSTRVRRQTTSANPRTKQSQRPRFDGAKRRNGEAANALLKKRRQKQLQAMRLQGKERARGHNKNAGRISQRGIQTRTQVPKYPRSELRKGGR